MNLIFILFLITSAATCINSAKILGVFMIPSHSHLTLQIRIMKALAEKGHEVTFITVMPLKTPIPNLTEIPIPEIQEAMQDIKAQLFEMDNMNFIMHTHIVSNMAITFTEKTLQHENIQKLLKSNKKFDVIILEYFWNEALMALANHFNCPLILLSPMPASSWINYLVANPGPTSYVPSLLSDFTVNMTFLQRVQNTLVTGFETIYRETRVLPIHRTLAKQYIPNAPDLDNIIYNSSLILVNSHSSMYSGIPHVPKMIEIGGYHVSPTKPLPKDLQNYLDNAKEGVILFSMGSNLKSADIPLEKRRSILNAFSKLKVKVLWKFETDLPDLPSNVKIQQWLPQQDILAHKNVKAFITHGGLLSTTETIYFGKPIIGIPIFGDQKMNMNTAVSNGYAISIPFGQLTEDTLSNALDEILNNPKYWNEAQRRSKLMLDRPLKPIDTAVYWIEYVARHKGAPHLQSAAIYLKWYQIHLLDVYGFLLCIVLISFYILSKLTCKLCKRKQVTSKTDINKKSK